MNTDRSPEFKKESFNCPHCNVFAQQNWLTNTVLIRNIITIESLHYEKMRPNRNSDQNNAVSYFLESLQKYWREYYILKNIHFLRNASLSTCQNCQEFAIWVDEKRVYPLTSSIPVHNKDMPEDVVEIYNEARTIAEYSPRATAALLRVGLEKLTTHLGETKGTLYQRIQNLKAKGLPETVIKSLDIVRITANEGGAHAGVIDLNNKDNAKIVETLFWLINFIVEKTISDPKEIDLMRDGLQEKRRNQQEK